jgi:hypothetical protein
MEQWSNDKDLFRLKFGFSFLPVLQYSKTPVLQDNWPSLMAKSLKFHLAQKTRFSMINERTGCPAVRQYTQGSARQERKEGME